MAVFDTSQLLQAVTQLEEGPVVQPMLESFKRAIFGKQNWQCEMNRKSGYGVKTAR
jgi:hypothetical protein